jgi:hypothetical protein
MRFCGEHFDIKGRREQDDGKNYTISSFIICYFC